MESNEQPNEGVPAEPAPGSEAEPAPPTTGIDHFQPSEDPESPFDFRTLPKMFVRVIRSPENGLIAVHTPGQTALFQGFVLGLGTTIIVPFVQWIAYKLGGDVDPGFLGTLRSVLGAGLYLASGTLMSMLLRATFGQVKSIDWIDDLFSFGGAMTFIMAGTLFGGVFYAIGGAFCTKLGVALSVVGVMWSGFAYYFSLSRIGQVAPERAVWLVGPVFAMALALGSFARFSPLMLLGL